MSKKGPVDYVGHTIKVGDRVAYPVRAGSSMWLTDMLVEEILLDNDNSILSPYKLKGTNTRGNRCIVSNLGRCVILNGGK